MRTRQAPLAQYQRKRDFSRTSEPSGARRKAARRKPDGLSFAVQRHAAHRLHYDFRLELDGVLKSWAVPKGPSLDPKDKRLAVEVEDHPLEYGEFEGTIPAGQYGAGEVRLWDRGTWTPEGDAHTGLARGHLKFRLDGEKLRGRWVLVRMPQKESEARHNWLLIKDADDAARRGDGADVVQRRPESVKPSRTGRASAIPSLLEPQLASTAAQLPSGAGWAFEAKYDGYRLLARLENGNVKLFTRSGKDWTARFPSAAEALGRLPARNAWIDAEAVVFARNGLTDFSALQSALEDSAGRSVVLVAFDLPFVDGEDLRAQPLEARRARLERLLSGRLDPALVLAQTVTGHGDEALRAACRLGLEGLIAKRLDSAYRPGRSISWLKLKCRPRDEFVIGGFTQPEGARSGIGALLVGEYERRKLRYRGRVGTGFAQRDLAGLQTKLAALERPDPPFAEAPPRHARAYKLHWVEPKLVAEVAYTGLTGSGMVRQASFMGLREDKPASAVASSKPAGTARRTRRPGAKQEAKRQTAGATVAGVTISHPHRELHDSGSTKLDLARYYEAVGEWMQPHLMDRPLALLRCPGGDFDACFFQRHAKPGLEGERAVPRDADYLLAHSPTGVVEIVQAGAIEFHTWGATVPRIDRPDRMTLDLDPDPDLEWPIVREACELVRALLGELELTGFPKTTGGKGMHIVAPLERRYGWDEVKEFSRAVATHLATALPTLFTANMAKSRRRGRIFIDYLRNGETATAVSAYSARARPGLPVSTPIRWEELRADVRGTAFDVRSVPARLRRLRTDPWAEYWTTKQRITAAARRVLS